mmetsp:Transcript_17004/g.52493  ORF Transcript_17004/g.52493 Transcript_17004/m.52493 type:complete len:298 (+) Transcript_17004:395-1288(+)
MFVRCGSCCGIVSCTGCACLIVATHCLGTRGTGASWHGKHVRDRTHLPDGLVVVIIPVTLVLLVGRLELAVQTPTQAVMVLHRLVGGILHDREQIAHSAVDEGLCGDGDHEVQLLAEARMLGGGRVHDVECIERSHRRLHVRLVGGGEAELHSVLERPPNGLPGEELGHAEQVVQHAGAWQHEQLAARAHEERRVGEAPRRLEVLVGAQAVHVHAGRPLVQAPKVSRPAEERVCARGRVVQVRVDHVSVCRLGRAHARVARVDGGEVDGAREAGEGARSQAPARWQGGGRRALGAAP